MRAEVSYRGFDASPVGGRAQGLAVYQNGVRINEAFGDTVNWDVIPSTAIESMTIVSNNPVFGLNAIGGAVSIVTVKDGFNYHGAEIDVLAGSVRARPGLRTGGMQSGTAAAYISIEGVTDEGFRDFSDPDIRRMYADIGLKGSKAEFHLSFTGADNNFGATAAAPEQLLAESWKPHLHLTSEHGHRSADADAERLGEGHGHADILRRRLLPQAQLEGDRRQLDRRRAVRSRRSQRPPVSRWRPCRRYFRQWYYGRPGRRRSAGLHRAHQHAGQQLRRPAAGRREDAAFGRPNQFLVGASYDHGRVKYNTSSEIGTVGNKFVVTGSGIILGGLGCRRQ